MCLQCHATAAGLLAASAELYIAFCTAALSTTCLQLDKTALGLVSLGPGICKDKLMQVGPGICKDKLMQVGPGICKDKLMQVGLLQDSLDHGSWNRMERMQP